MAAAAAQTPPPKDAARRSKGQGAAPCPDADSSSMQPRPPRQTTHLRARAGAFPPSRAPAPTHPSDMPALRARPSVSVSVSVSLLRRLSSWPHRTHNGGGLCCAGRRGSGALPSRRGKLCATPPRSLVVAPPDGATPTGYVQHVSRTLEQSALAAALAIVASSACALTCLRSSARIRTHHNIANEGFRGLCPLHWFAARRVEGGCVCVYSSKHSLFKISTAHQERAHVKSPPAALRPPDLHGP